MLWRMKYQYRHTKIIFTLGPATAEEGVMEQLFLAGAGICRLNMAHANHDWIRQMIARVREVSGHLGRPVPILMDVKGPEIRTGDLPEPIELKTGDLLDLLVNQEAKDPAVNGVTVNYPGIVNDLNAGNTVLVDSGLIHLKVVDKTESRLRCEVVIGGRMGNRRHINLPGVHVKLPALTEKDLKDIAVGMEEGVEFFALSFVRQASDIELLREHLKQGGSRARIIAKIEDQSAIANLDSIIEACDGLMVARGDLGIECPYEELPIIQRSTVNACIKRGKPVIVATHMLESMITAPVPTRAEVSDVANAVFEQTDCIMLSGETTVGKYPVECVKIMARISEQIENSAEPSFRDDLKLHRPKDKLLRSAVTLAQDLKKAGIIVFTRSGYLAQIVSSLRPIGCPIYAFTDDPILFRQMHLLWGIEPFLTEFSKDPEETIRNAFLALHSRHWVRKGDWQVVVMNAIHKEKLVDSIQLRQVDWD
jgi:pyruvate kinase